MMRKKDREVIYELKKQIEVLLKGKGNVYNYSQNIIVRPFGKENLSYIQDDYVKELISKELTLVFLDYLNIFTLMINIKKTEI